MTRSPHNRNSKIVCGIFIHFELQDNPGGKLTKFSQTFLKVDVENEEIDSSSIKMLKVCHRSLSGNIIIIIINSFYIAQNYS